MLNRRLKFLDDYEIELLKYLSFLDVSPYFDNTFTVPLHMILDLVE